MTTVLLVFAIIFRKKKRIFIQNRKFEIIVNIPFILITETPFMNKIQSNELGKN